uniref:NR LBD domain-containing protein n=1 Tax=Panagrellus redivivus TaxID=6233 RepID=A0A7E4ZRJ5_PANRE
MDAAMSSLDHAIDDLEVIRIAYLIHYETKKLLDSGMSIYNLGIVIQTEAGILLEKFRNSDPIPFKKLPYEFQNRLVALLPRNDMATFSSAGKSAVKAVKIRGERRGVTYSTAFLVTEPEPAFTQKYKNRKNYDILDTTYFQKLDNYFISYGVCLRSRAVETFDHAVKIVSGTYRYVDLRVSYTWRHAIHLINVSKFIKFAYLWHHVQLEVEDFDEFFEAVVQWLINKKSALMFHMVYQHLDASFRSRFEDGIKARTKLNIHFLNSQVVVYKPLKML